MDSHMEAAPAQESLPVAPSLAPASFASLTVVIPAFNEEQGILPTLQQLRQALPEAEILVVDDGSTDRTAEIARSVPGVTVLAHVRNRGYGASLKTALRRCTRPFVAWYDADGQHQPSDLARVALPVVQGQKDLVIGVRGKDSSQQRDRIAGKMLLYWAARLISREEIPDLNSGLRCFRRAVLLRYLHLLPDGFSASTTSTLMMLKMGYRVGYAPMVAQARQGQSTVRIVRDGLRTLHLIVRIVVLFEAFKVFSLCGLGLLIFGMVYGFAVALTRGAGFPTLAGTAVLSGLLTFFMGIIADQVVEMRKERFDVHPGAAAEDVSSDGQPPSEEG